MNWSNWLERWDKQQERYIPNREERFQVMFDVVEAQIGQNFTAVDLGCGPGSLSQRLIERFPASEVYAFDIDPMLLKIANNAIGDKDGRIKFIEADLREDNWVDYVGETKIDAVLSSTALHWLPPVDLFSLYHHLGDIIRAGGVFLNAEGISFPRRYNKFPELIDRVKEIRNDRHKEMEGEEWDLYWERLKEAFSENNMADLVEERESRFHWRDHTEHRSPSFELQKSALEDLHFSEVDTIWQDLNNRVLLAIK